MVHLSGGTKPTPANLTYNLTVHARNAMILQCKSAAIASAANDWQTHRTIWRACVPPSPPAGRECRRWCVLSPFDADSNHMLHTASNRPMVLAWQVTGS